MHCKSTVRFSKSFSTTKNSFRKMWLRPCADLATVFALTLVTSASVVLADRAAPILLRAAGFPTIRRPPRLVPDCAS